MKQKNVLGYEGYYVVTEDGIVSSLRRKVGYRIAGLQKEVAGKVIKPRKNTHGYMSLCLSKNGKVAHVTVHKIVAEAFYGKKPDNLEVSHLDGDKLNNHYKNLKYVTHTENEHQKVLHGTVPYGKKNGKYTKPEKTPKGERHGCTKLNEKTVSAIRKSNLSSRELAKIYSVSKTNILNIKNNEIWRT